MDTQLTNSVDPVLTLCPVSSLFACISKKPTLDPPKLVRSPFEISQSLVLIYSLPFFLVSQKLFESNFEQSFVLVNFDIDAFTSLEVELPYSFVVLLLQSALKVGLCKDSIFLLVLLLSLVLLKMSESCGQRLAESKLT